MGNKYGERNAARVVLCAFFLAGVAHAETVTPEDEFSQRIRTSKAIQPLGEKPFGEDISLYTGALTFRQMDLSLEGLGLPIQLQRTFNPDTDRGLSTTSARAFVDWRLEVPHIETLSTNASGDAPGFFLSDANRCSNFKAAPTIVLTTGSSAQPIFYFPEQWWAGYQLVIPGSGRQDLLKRDASNTAAPQMTDTDGSARSFPIVTKQNWMVSCLAQTSNGATGEGFLVVSPDGVKYWMDWLTSRVHDKVGFAQPGFGGVARGVAMMMVSRVEDRFGNSLTYQYASNGDLTSIQASDGRTLTLAYETWSRAIGTATESGTRITSATLQASDTAARTWRYGYGVLSDNRTHLVSVTQPDNSAWGFDLSGFNTLSPRSYVNYDKGCDNFVLNPQTVTANVTLRHPSGLVGTLSVGTALRGRSYVPYACNISASGAESLYTPNVYVTWNLVKKTFSGPGLADKVWSYTYSDPTYSWSKDCASGCASTVWTTIVDPDGRATRYTFSNRFDASESSLLKVETFTGAIGSTLARSETDTYASATAGPWPSRFGSVLLGNLNLDQVEQTAPLSVRTLDQDSASYTHRNDSFDAYARPLSVTRSSPWHSRTDVTGYYDNAAKWVLGQLANSTNSDTGLVEHQVTYSANAQPLTITQFGKLRQTLTYNGDGTVATVKDGNNNTATLSSWKRGIPQSITFADGKAISAVVNDNGWVTSVTDENGYATGYGYDAMGRLANLTYPSGDSTAWNATTQAFEPVAATEYGIAAGHWRQTVATGNARKVTYFDALWRPLLTREYDSADEAGTQRFQRFSYDHDGRVTFASYLGSSDALSTGTWTEYDALGRTTSVSQDSELGLLTTTTEYLASNQTRVTSPRGQTTVSGYQVFDQPAYDKPVWIQHPEGAYTDIARDVFGKPTAIVRRNADSSTAVTRRYVYDGNQQLCKSIEPESGAAVMAYDGAGNLSWSASGQDYPSASACNTADVATAQKVSRSYDARNRLTALTFPDGIGNQTWSYTADGLPSQVTTYNSNGGDTAVNTYTYNKRRLLTGESISQPGWYNWSLGYGYDANGALSSLAYPSGLNVNYAPNALGQPTQAGSYASSVSYYPNGAIKQFTYGNGIVHTMTQNARQLPTRSTDSGASNPLNLGYSFDANANVSAITDYTTSARQTRSMTYDGLDRLLTTQSVMFGGDNLAGYSYDVLDNLVSSKVGSRYDYRYVYNANQQLLTVSNPSGAAVIGLGYDVRGNLANKNGVLYGFDLGNRLRQVTGQETYRYDAHGRRVSATSPTLGSILSFYGQDGTLRYQRDERTAAVFQYVSLGGSLVAKVTGSALPLAPGLTVPANSTTGSYTVSWTTVSGTTSYQLQEQANGGSWVAAYSGTATSQSISGKGSGSYAYRVRSCLNANCGDWSATATTTVLLAPSAAPTLAVPSTGANGSYTVSWTTVATASSYALEESSNGGSSWNAVQGSGATSWNASGKAAGSYVYRVNACNSTGCGPYSSSGTVQVIYPPGSAPTASAPSSNTSGSYTVSWTTVATATSYTLEESGDGGGSWSAVQSSNASSWGASGKAAGTYSYRVKACNVAGCGSYSGTVSTQVVYAPTSAPTLTVPSSSATGSYSVSWTTVAAATSYTLEESSNGGSSWSTVQSAASSSASISGKGDGSYVYRVKGCNLAGCGGYSGTQTVTVAIPPPVPTGLKLVGSSSTGTFTTYKASWSAVSGATRYELNGAASYSGTSTSYSWTQSGAFSSVWTVRVRSCNAVACSEWTAYVNAVKQ